MDWITDRIAIGNYLEARDGAMLRGFGIRSVLSLDGTVAESHAAELGLSRVVSYELIDGPGNDLRIVEFAVRDLRMLAAASAPVLVQCHAGRSRSVIVVAAHLVQTLGVDPDEAVAIIAAKRGVNVTPALLELLDRLDA